MANRKGAWRPRWLFLQIPARVEHEAEFDGLLMDSVAVLLAVKAVRLKRLAQDGMRVSANADASSFWLALTVENMPTLGGVAAHFA
ncbi:hypothetical protein [Nitrosomonas sp. Nm132]|uniref:hypothetical protein n=1 Tax=Nitrosomonas sp. Nm132 TaxID=1881053 RepID=UPI0011600068|nr:hypothetical protein [Nitrosomonas sp. Nm132]